MPKAKASSLFDRVKTIAANPTPQRSVLDKLTAEQATEFIKVVKAFHAGEFGLLSRAGCITAINESGLLPVTIRASSFRTVLVRIQKGEL